MDYAADNADIHVLYGDDEVTVFIAPNSDEDMIEECDVSSMFENINDAAVQLLSAASGQDLADNSSDAKVEEIPFDEVYQDGKLIADFGPGDILQIVIHDFEPTEDFDQTMEDIGISLGIVPMEEIETSDVLSVSDAADGQSTDESTRGAPRDDPQPSPEAQDDSQQDAPETEPLQAAAAPGDIIALFDTTTEIENGGEENGKHKGDGGGGGFVAQMGMRSHCPLPQTDLVYGHGMGYAGSSDAI